MGRKEEPTPRTKGCELKLELSRARVGSEKRRARARTGAFRSIGQERRKQYGGWLEPGFQASSGPLRLCPPKTTAHDRTWPSREGHVHFSSENERPALRWPRSQTYQERAYR